MDTTKKWPEERDLLAWYLDLEVSIDDAPEDIKVHLDNFTAMGFVAVHHYIHTNNPRFRELFMSPDITQEEKQTDVSAFLDDNKEAISEELHRQFKKAKRKD